MTTLSIILPDTLAKASQEAAQKLGVSRTQFIRQAIAHEIDHFHAQLEEIAMAKSMEAMKKDKRYLAESDDIMDTFNADLPKEKKEWWKKEKS